LHVTLRRIVPLSLIIAAGIGVAVSHANAKFERIIDPRGQAVAAVTKVVNAAREPFKLVRTQKAEAEWVWEGRDIDGDGAPDFMNPTGKGVRGHDDFGYGEFGASRDGGSRAHEGVDYIADAGQKVFAPISGFVTKIGFAYAGDSHRFVEITNPALKFEARVFYVDPTVQVGDVVRLGAPIGKMDTLQHRYAGITDHVHLEMMDRGRRMDATRLITAELKAPSARG
jgi:murein DD-endopeptidase MepM/ murein hydrolase activator NlpD